MQSNSPSALSALLPDKSVRLIPALTGVRAIAVYFVFLHHYNPGPPITLANRLFEQGYIGVSIFFVLSGFLIYHRYANDYLAQGNWSWRRYLRNRFARIYPLYALLLFVTVCVNTLLNRPMSYSLVALNLSLVKGFFNEYKFSGIAQSWSLTVEICFYLVAPLLFVALRRWGTFPLTVGLVSIGLLLWLLDGQVAWHGLFSPLPFVFFYTFFGRAFEFIVGMWLARCWNQNRWSQIRYATVAGLFILVVCALWQANIPNLIASSAGLMISEIVVYNAIMPVGIGLFLLGLLREKSMIQQVLSQRIMQRLGRSSYAFYLIHSGVVANGLQKVGVTNQWLLFCLLVIIAYGLYISVEKPLQRWLRVY